MNNGSKLLLLIVTVFLLSSSLQVECRRTYSSRSSSSGRGNRGKNQPSSGGIFSSWFGGSKSSGSVSKPAPATPKKNWQTVSSQASAQSKANSNWANPYYKPPGSASVPSAPSQTAYGWKPASAPSPYPSSNIGPRGYPVQTGLHQPPQTGFGGFKPAPSVPHTAYQPSQTGYRPPSGVPNAPATGFHPSGYQPGYGGYHSAPSYHPPQTPHGYQSSFHPSGYSPQTAFSGALPTYQGTKLFGGSSGHYGYPGGSTWGIDTYGSRKSSGTGKLLTGLAVGAAGGYLTSSLVNSISNPWKYSGWGYGSRYGYGSGPGYDYARSRDESAFERGFERGVQSRQQTENIAKQDAAAPLLPDDPTSKWVQCVAFDPQTHQTLINPNCTCTVTTSVDERTGQPLSVHHCTTLNGLVMHPIPVNPPPPPVTGVNAPGAVPSYAGAYLGGVQYGAPPAVPLSPNPEPSLQPNQGQTAKESVSEKAATESGSQLTTTEAKPDQSTTEKRPESTTGSVPETEVGASEKLATVESIVGGTGEVPSAAEKLSGGLQENRKRTAEFYGQLQKIVNMGNFVDGV